MAEHEIHIFYNRGSKIVQFLHFPYAVPHSDTAYVLMRQHVDALHIHVLLCDN